ncbi:MAG: ROK family protein [Planctomycetota bacterium]
MNGQRLVGLDIGGTSIKGGAIDTGGEVLARGARDFDPSVPAAEIFARCASLARELGFEGRLGVGCAGLFERETGMTDASANMPNLVGVSLTAGIAEALGVPLEQIHLENDANAAAVGEQWLGGGQGARDVVFVTLGTGIGGGIILDGKLFIGASGKAGEFGHISVRPEAAKQPDDGELRCKCGAYGCIERLASATAAMTRARNRGLGDDLPSISAAAQRGPGPERELMHAIGRDLGQAMADTVLLLDVPLFVVGGGFGGALEALRPGIEEVLRERAYGRPPAQVTGAQLGADAGWIGAARLAPRA